MSSIKNIFYYIEKLSITRPEYATDVDDTTIKYSNDINTENVGIDAIFVGILPFSCGRTKKI